MTIKHLYMLAAAAVVALPGMAQQRYQISQYGATPYMLNPAAAGAAGFTDVKVGFRRQWASISDGPQTFFGSFNTRLGMGETPPATRGLLIRTRKAFANVVVKQDPTPKAYHGIGANVIIDQTGPYSRNAAYVSYAYNLPLSKSFRLGLGVHAGGLQYQINSDKLDYGQADPTKGTGTRSSVVPDITLGAMLFHKSFYLGYSANQLLQNKLDISASGQAKQKLVLHQLLQLGVALPLTEDLTLNPSAIAKVTSNAPTTFDANLRLAYQNKIWISGGYRYQDAFIIGAGVLISNLISAGYAYDATSSGLSSVAGGGHEIIVGLRLGKQKPSLSPTLFY